VTWIQAWLLPLGLLVPLLFGIAAWLYLRRRARVAAILGDRHLVGRLSGGQLALAPLGRLALLVLVALALGAALADPRGGFAVESATEGRDVVLILDASNSMLVEDVRPNRLDQQRQIAHRIARTLVAERVGVVAFAGQANVLTPPTIDPQALGMYIDVVRPQVVPQTGTSLAAGIRQASALLAAAPGGRRIRGAVLISDGEPIEEEEQRAAAVAAARQAAALGVVVHTVGVGTPAGGFVPHVDPATGMRRGYKTDPLTGTTAISRLDDRLLGEIARLTGGSYYAGGDHRDLERLLVALGAASQDAAGDDPAAQRVPRPFWLLSFAVLLLMADGLRATRPWRRRED
jgi:Ca-activated chloride channel homolog